MLVSQIKKEEAMNEEYVEKNYNCDADIIVCKRGFRHES